MAGFRWSKLRVLIVEKDEMATAMLRSTLRSVKTWMVRNTDALAEAQNILRGFPADLVLVNAELTDGDGLSLARAIRSDDGVTPPDLPVLLMMPKTDPDSLRRAAAAGVDKVARTPIKRDVILKQIATLMVGRTRRDRAVPAEAERPAAAAPSKGNGVSSRGRGKAAAPVRGNGGGGTVLGPANAEAKPNGGQGIEGAGIETAPAAAGRKSRDWPDEPAGRGKPRHSDDAWKAAQRDARKRPEKNAASGPDIGEILETHATWLRTRGREGERADLAGADLYRAELASADLANANLRRAVLSDANCVGARFASADLRQSDLSGSDIKEGNLSVANLRHANLSASCLDDAVLKQADLAGVTLRGASLKGTDLTGANLLEADLRGADLTQAAGLTRAQVKKARGDHTTLLPPAVRVKWGDDSDSLAAD